MKSPSGLQEIAMLAWLFASTAHGADFFCDPLKGTPEGDGSAARPWRTAEEVLTSGKMQWRDAKGGVANPSAPVKAGDNLLLNSGWHGVLRIKAGFNPRPITIKAAPGQEPNVGWVQAQGGTGWVIKGLTVSTALSPTPLSKTPRALVTLGEQGNAENSGLIVEDCFVYGVLDHTNWSAADWVQKAPDGISLGRNGKGHVAKNNFVLNTRFGIALCAPEARCEGNVVVNFSGDGIRATRDGQVVEHNIVRNNFVSEQDGDRNHDDGIQVFLFNVGTGTLRDLTFRGNLVISRDDDSLPYPNPMQGLGFFDGPLVNFIVEDNVVLVNHYHGITLADAQGCTIRGNTCYSRWPGRLMPWIRLGQKKNQARGNVVCDNYAHSFNFDADKEVKAENNRTVSLWRYQESQAAVVREIEAKYGRLHPTAKRARLGQATW
jgi:parallel beta-helix repeat protein